MLIGFSKSDDAVIRQVLAGRRERFGILVTRYQPVIYGVALAQTGNHTDAEDVVQDTFLKAFQSLGKLRESHKFGSWLASIAKNISRDLRSKHFREPTLAEGLEEQIDTSTNDLGKKELHDLLWVQILKLDEIVLEILILHYFSGKNTREIAGILEISIDASEKRLQRARDVLGRKLVGVLGAELQHRPSKRYTKKVLAAIAVLPAARRVSTASAAEGHPISAWLSTHASAGWHPLAIGVIVLATVGVGSLWLMGSEEAHRGSGESLKAESPNLRIANVGGLTALGEVSGVSVSDTIPSS